MDKPASPSIEDREFKGKAALLAFAAGQQAIASTVHVRVGIKAAPRSLHPAALSLSASKSASNGVRSTPQRTCQPSTRPSPTAAPAQGMPSCTPYRFWSLAKLRSGGGRTQGVQSRLHGVVQGVGPNRSVNRTRYGKAPWPRGSLGPSSASRPGRLASAGRLPLR